MGDSTAYTVSEKPITFGVDDSDQQFFNSIDEPSQGNQFGYNMTTYDPYQNQVQDGSDAMRQDAGQGFQMNTFDQETYAPIQGYQRQYVDESDYKVREGYNYDDRRDFGGVTPASEGFDGSVAKQDNLGSYPGAVEDSGALPPPPPMAFQNQSKDTDAGSNGFGSISSLQQKGYGATATASFAPPPSGLAFGGAVTTMTVPHADVVDSIANNQSAVSPREESRGNDNKGQYEAESPSLSDRTEQVKMGKVNPSLQAGRRKLEEFKRKKAAVLSRKNSSTQQHEYVKAEFTDAKLEEAREEIQRLKIEVKMLSNDLERRAEERSEMEREKAALLGELVSLKANVEESPASAQAIELLREEIGAMKDRIESLESSLSISRKECASLVEERETLIDELNALKIKVAVPPPPPPQSVDSADALRSELDELKSRYTLAQIELDQKAVELSNMQVQIEESRMREQQAQGDLMDATENIESLRELLKEGEQERVELVSINNELQSQVQATQGQSVVVDPTQTVALESALHAKDLEIDRLNQSLMEYQREVNDLKSKAEESSIDFSGDMNGGMLSPSEHALRTRLAKAEAAVEVERKAFQELQQKISQLHEAAEENVALKSQMIQMRENEHHLEQQIQAMQQSGMMGQSSVPQPSFNESEVQQAYQRAETAEFEAHALRSELEQSTSTITRLSGEVNDLITRLKDQSELIVQLKQEAEPLESIPIHDVDQVSAQPPPPSVHVEQQVQYDATQPPPPQFQPALAPPVFTQPENNAEQSIFDFYDHPIAQPPQQETAPAPEQQQVFPSAPAPQPTQQWSVPGGIIEQDSSPRMQGGPNEKETTPKRKVGFWSWVAGADLAESN